VGKNLVIVESPAKIKTIRNILGKHYDIKATIGHIKDIPTNSLGVDVENDFKMTFTTIKGKFKAIKEIKAAAQKADRIFLATDPDREGEAISWHVSNLVPSSKPVDRITFNAITRTAIEAALKKPTQINQPVVNSQFARRIIDRLIGYILSPEASRHLSEKFSVGRVQSPAVALVVEREREIRAFEPKPYWLIKATYQKNKSKFVAGLKQGRVTDEKTAERIAKNIEAAVEHKIVKVEKKETKKTPPPPFITSTFQRAAFKAYRMGSKFAMRLAQDLYEGQEVSGKHVALITYMRTDSPRISNEGLAAAKEQVIGQFGAEYYKSRNFKSKGGAQDAHEAIRPAHPDITPEMVKKDLDDAHFKIYSLIYKRWLASQMQPAKYDQVKALIEADGEQLEAVGSTLIFEGFLKIYGKDLNEEEAENDDDNDERKLPELSENDLLNLLNLSNEKKMTLPPPRYNNGSLVEKLEKLQIGRPSTYASIVDLIQYREYVEETTGKKREFKPTKKGEQIYDYLKEHRPIVIDYEFTAKMENQLDEVETGKKSYLEVVKEEFEKIKDAYEMYKKGGGFAMSRKPTARQLQFASRLSEVTKKEIPKEVLEDSKKLSTWIDDLKGDGELPSLPPSEKQLKYAESLAKDTQMELTDELRADSKKISEFIDQARKILDQKIAANKHTFAINYMNEDGVEHEFEVTEIVDIIDVADKKAIGLRFDARRTKWIPRSQIERHTDQALTLKNKWAAENVYGSASKKKVWKKKSAKKSAKKTAKKATAKK